VKCDLSPREWIVVGRLDDEKDMRREYDARVQAGFDLSWLNRKQLDKKMNLDASAGMRLRDGFTLDPYRACVGLAVTAARRGAACFEHSPVKKVRFTRKHADVVTDRGTIRTGAVIVTTGSATTEFKQLQRHFKRRESYFVMTEPVPGAMRRLLGDPEVVLGDVRTPPHRIRWSDGRLVVAGAEQNETPAKARASVRVQRTGQLMYELLTMYPAISGLQPAYGWEAGTGETADGVMYIGAHRNYPHHLFALGGGAGGVTGAFVAARVLLRAIKRTPDKADEVFGWVR
jgi:glycine/D-amino acid oxidase-like deaminating enzyme